MRAPGGGHPHTPDRGFGGGSSLWRRGLELPAPSAGRVRLSFQLLAVPPPSSPQTAWAHLGPRGGCARRSPWAAHESDVSSFKSHQSPRLLPTPSNLGTYI